MVVKIGCEQRYLSVLLNLTNAAQTPLHFTVNRFPHVHLNVISCTLLTITDCTRPQIKPHIHTKHVRNTPSIVALQLKQRGVWMVQIDCRCCWKWMAGLLHAVSWASSERGWGPLREGTAALLHRLSHSFVLLCPLCTVYPLEWYVPQCKGHIFRFVNCIYELVSEGPCTAHSVAHFVSQGPFTWLTSGRKG